MLLVTVHETAYISKKKVNNLVIHSENGSLKPEVECYASPVCIIHIVIYRSGSIYGLV